MTKTKNNEKLSCSVELNFDESDSENQSNKEIVESSLEGLDSTLKSNDLTISIEEENKNSSGPFESFGFSDNLIQTLHEKGYKEPSPIQKAAIPELMLGRDLVGQAQTGTGKTAAFALPILERINEESKLPQSLVLAPTRELAMQVADSFKAYAANHPKFKVLAVYGGADFRTQINSLKRGIDVVVGTPGRVMDHMRQGTLNTSDLNTLVLDEADEMLRMGFIDDVEWILDKLPEKRQMILFSATMPTEIRRLSKQYLQNPAEITIKSKTKEAKLITQKFITIHNSHKIECLKRVLEAKSGDGVIIFVRTKVISLVVSEALESVGHDVGVLNGDVPQSQRERTVERLRNGNIDILVATDVAARGLDVERIGLVINYDMPFDREAYVHRIGRTGRAGRTGEAILFVNPRERHFLGSLERAGGQPIEQMEIPNNETINKSRIEKLKNQLKKSAEEGRDCNKELKILGEVLEHIEEELELGYKEIATAALSLAIGNEPLLAKGDEGWLKQMPMRQRRNDQKDSRSNYRRRNEKDNGRMESNMERFRVEVGRRDRVKPGNLVGAIANESGLEGRRIGRIQIYENYSFIDLPTGMPASIFKDLKKLKVMSRELQISRAN